MKRSALLYILNILGLLAVVFMVSAAEAKTDERTVRISWKKPPTQEDGTPIPPEDLTVTVFKGAEVGVCIADPDTTCDVLVAWDVCEPYYAKATQLSTGLVSVSSPTVEVCAGPEPDWDVAPFPPILEIELL